MDPRVTRDPTTGDIPDVTRSNAVAFLAEEFVVVGIMYYAIHNLPGRPGECRMTLDAKHLVTPVSLENATMAFGTGFGRALEFSDRSHVVGLTGVVFRFDFMAVFANGRFTQPAFVVGR